MSVLCDVEFMWHFSLADHIISSWAVLAESLASASHNKPRGSYVMYHPCSDVMISASPCLSDSNLGSKLLHWQLTGLPWLVRCETPEKIKIKSACFISQGQKVPCKVGKYQITSQRQSDQEEIKSQVNSENPVVYHKGLCMCVYFHSDHLNACF